jgi:beta-lactamase class A
MKIRLPILVTLLVASFALLVYGNEAGPRAVLGVVPDPKHEEPGKPMTSHALPTWAVLWNRSDANIQRRLEAAIEGLGLETPVEKRALSIVLVDITDLREPRVASLNGDVMIYAASLPKIAVLLTAVSQVADGKLEMDSELRTLLEQMIRRSSNTATTEVMHRVGKENIAKVLQQSRYGLYDPSHNGGLWVGKDYASSGLWRRDPMHNLSHGATAMQVARFYYLLETERLVSPEHSRLMKEIMSGDHIKHKFVAGLDAIDPNAEIMRKSGSWRSYHADSVLVRRQGRSYIAVALADDAKGKSWLPQLIQEFDAIIMALER